MLLCMWAKKQANNVWTRTTNCRSLLMLAGRFEVWAAMSLLATGAASLWYVTWIHGRYSMTIFSSASTWFGGTSEGQQGWFSVCLAP